MGAISARRKLEPFTAALYAEASYKPIIFLSYAQADEPERPLEGEVKWLSFVRGHLQAAEEFGAFEIWTEPLAPGADLNPEILRKLRACDIFVPLVSPHSVAYEAVVGRQIAIIRERQAKGESVYIYPLLLAPTPKSTVDLVRAEDLRPLGGRPFSSYASSERDLLMLDATNEIVEIAADAAALKTRRRTRSPLSPLLRASQGSPRRRTDRRPARESETIEQESLEGWLTKQVPQVTAAIAARAALRVTPPVGLARYENNGTQMTPPGSWLRQAQSFEQPRWRKSSPNIQTTPMSCAPSRLSPPKTPPPHTSTDFPSSPLPTSLPSLT